ncbi:MAG: hypothetical protein V3S71_03170, partial [Acidobacteriota bacterium]
MIVGITGKAGSGKDTVANFLVGEYGFRRAQFAYELKRIVCEIFNWNRNLLDELEYKEEVPLNQDGTPQCPGPTKLYPGGMSRRQVLIFFGTDCMRAIDPDIHVKLAMQQIDPTLRAFPIRRSSQFVFPDVRFLNEAEAIKKRGGEIWRVVKLAGSGTDAGSADHVSETE